MLRVFQYTWIAVKIEGLLLAVFLWHTVLSTQLVIPHTGNGILNYTFILCAYSWMEQNAP